MCIYITEGGKTNNQSTENGTSAASQTSSYLHTCDVYRNVGKYHAMETTIYILYFFIIIHRGKRAVFLYTNSRNFTSVAWKF